MSMDERLHHLFGRMPEAKVHLYGKGERPGRKIGHVNILGASSGSLADDAYVADVRERATRAAHWLSHAEWTDGWDGHMTERAQPRVGVIMGSDSDWSVMEDAAQALAEFDVPFEVGVVSAHRTPGRMLDYARSAAGRGIEVIIAGAGGAAHLPGMVAVGDAAAGDRGAGAAGQARRPGLAAVDRADARRRAGGHGVDRRRPQRRTAGGAHPRRVGCRAARRGWTEFQSNLADMVLEKDAALRNRLLGRAIGDGKVTGE